MALQHSIMINRASYDLAPNLDIRALMDEIEAAAQDGGRFVSLPLVRDRYVDVLVTPGLAVNIESRSPQELELVPALDDHPFPGGFDEFDEFSDI